MEQNPDVKLKVDGKYLLNLRTKINDLERELDLKIKEMNALAEQLSSTKSDLSNVNKKVDEYEVKLNSAEKEITKLNQVILDKKNEQLKFNP